ncbi:PREDICTED: glucosidase 2 subunit beta-like [Diuraphis noxia]|uniref:glucosidase 2 subunit beta-like n=1 Tax=Diuraphis noxia TaxID=143948 RepID=UPI0007637BA6|nr:PREDICTED: glucosidase 2 subunit beta-like [Diuraphis noxia]
MTEMENCYLIISIFCGIFTVINCTNIVKPRGIAFERASLYVPDKDFSCFDGSYIIPFSLVNDDYCDCPDASDEPGTSACPNGTFHCTNAGHTSLVIPSSRVNDGICDTSEFNIFKLLFICLIFILEAKQARNAFEEADRKFRDLQREVTHLQESLNKDFGPEDEFAALDGECYELSDREYVYKLCLFDQITQRSKNGGSEVRLGTWNSWIGEPKYRTMLYDRGQHCWNGPQRSTHVRLTCGLEPALLSATEPNRCEYAMDFVVPAVCVQDNEMLSARVTDSEHDEL